MKKFFTITRRKGCENEPLIIMTFEAENIVEAARMVVENFGSCYMAEPTKAVMTSEEANRIWLHGVINGLSPIS